MEYSFLEKLKISDPYIYWIFLYSYDHYCLDKKLNPNSLLLFPLTTFTPYKNRGLYTYTSHKKLDLNLDEDLDLILNKYKLRNVLSVSELHIKNNTYVVCLEIKNKKYTRLVRHPHIFFYTTKHSPSYYIEKDEYLDEESGIMIPNNRFLLSKIKLHIDKLGCVITNVVLNKIFTFLFDDLFEEKLSKYNKTKDEDEVFDLFSKVLKLKNIKEKTEDSNKQKICNGDSDSDSDLSSCNTEDSNLSFYSYQRKHGLPVLVKDI